MQREPQAKLSFGLSKSAPPTRPAIPQLPSLPTVKAPKVQIPDAPVFPVMPLFKQWRHVLVIALAFIATVVGLGQNFSGNTSASDLIGGASSGNATTSTTAQPRVLGAAISKANVQLPEVKSIELPPVPTKNENAKAPLINAANAIILDDESKLPLYEKGADQRIPIASTTKVVTAIVALKHYDPNEKVSISASAAGVIGSAVGFRVGETATVEQLLYGLMMVSGNDAAYMLAEHMAQPGDTDKMSRFVDEMNKTAKELSMTNSYFKNPAGLDDSAYSTPADMAKALSFALKSDEFKKIFKTPTYEYTSAEGYRHTFTSSNRLLTDEMHYNGIIGGKTGYTPEAEGGAGHCLIAAAERNGHILIAAIYKTYSSAPQASAEVARAALDYGFNNFTWQPVSR